MKAIVIDDEGLALQSMERLLKKYDIDICASFKDPIKLLKSSVCTEADVAFVDVEMPGMSGLETAERLQSLFPHLHIVFVTAYDQYAVDAFDIAAVDYLLKPVQPKRLEKTLDRLQKLQKETDNGTSRHSIPMICCFDRLCYQDAAGQVRDIAWRTVKARELFAFLIHMRGHTVLKETILELLWPDLSLDKAMVNLHTTIYQIRKALKRTEIPSLIVYAEGRYYLKLNGVRVDVDEWEASLNPSFPTPQPVSEQVRLLQMYTGDYFEQEGYVWAEDEREHLRRKWLNYTNQVVADWENIGRVHEAITLMKEVKKRFPLLEHSYFQLMKLYDKTGDYTEVKRQYETLREILITELDIPPSQEITRWYECWFKRFSHMN